ncbi:MAG TPA: hypothetical protein DEP82_07590 [Arthrobacter bacterium]|jgi:hypothetical protein|nr:hypothetical protein [Arthrobacter sp.]
MDIIDTGKVLAKIQAFDNRNVDDPTQIAWQEILEPYMLQDALDAVTHYFKANTGWIMPAHVVERVRDTEQARVRMFKNGCHLNRADEERTLEASGFDSWSDAMKALNRAAATGQITPDAYEAYQESEQTLASVLGSQKAIK